MQENHIAEIDAPALHPPTADAADPNSLDRGRWLESTSGLFSVEVCPNRALDATTLARIAPKMCSVTWHAQSMEEGMPAVRLAGQLRRQGYEVLLHLAGRNLRKEQVVEILDSVKRSGVRNLLALQGDPSSILEKDDAKCDFPYAFHLVEFIRGKYGNFFVIGVAGYPEKHPQSKNNDQDMEYLKKKISCGAEFIVTQACFTFKAISTFTKRCRSAGITVPIIPGIFVITSCGTLRAMSALCSVTVPPDVLDAVERLKDDADAVKEFGIRHAAQLAGEILAGDEDFGGIHVFTLNNFEVLEEVLRRLEILGSR